MLYDLGILRKLSDNDETFIIDMLQTFKKTTPPILQTNGRIFVTTEI